MDKDAICDRKHSEQDSQVTSTSLGNSASEIDRVESYEQDKTSDLSALMKLAEVACVESEKGLSEENVPSATNVHLPSCIPDINASSLVSEEINKFSSKSKESDTDGSNIPHTEPTSKVETPTLAKTRENDEFCTQGNVEEQKNDAKCISDCKHKNIGMILSKDVITMTREETRIFETTLEQTAKPKNLQKGAVLPTENERTSDSKSIDKAVDSKEMGEKAVDNYLQIEGAMIKSRQVETKVIEAIKSTQIEEQHVVESTQIEELKAVESTQIEELNAVRSTRVEENAPKSAQIEEETVRTKQVEKEEIVITKQVEKEETVKTKQVEKEETVKTKQVEKEETVKTKQVEKEETVKTKQVEKEETVKTKQVEKEEAVNTKQVEKEEAVKTEQVEKEEAVKTKQVEEEETVKTKQVEEEETVKTKQVEEEETVKTKQVEKEETVESKQIDEEAIVESKEIDQKATVESKLTKEETQILKPIKEEVVDSELENKVVESKQTEEFTVGSRQIEEKEIESRLIEDTTVKSEKIESEGVKSEKIPDQVKFEQLLEEKNESKSIRTPKLIETDLVTETLKPSGIETDTVEGTESLKQNIDVEKKKEAFTKTLDKLERSNGNNRTSSDTMNCLKPVAYQAEIQDDLSNESVLVRTPEPLKLKENVNDQVKRKDFDNSSECDKSTLNNLTSEEFENTENRGPCEKEHVNNMAETTRISLPKSVSSDEPMSINREKSSIASPKEILVSSQSSLNSTEGPEDIKFTEDLINMSIDSSNSNKSNKRNQSKIRSPPTDSNLSKRIKLDHSSRPNKLKRKKQMDIGEIIEQIRLGHMVTVNDHPSVLVCTRCREIWNEDVLHALFIGDESVTVNSRITCGSIILMAHFGRTHYDKDEEKFVKELLARADFVNKLGPIKICDLDRGIRSYLKQGKIHCCDAFRPVYRAIETSSSKKKRIACEILQFSTVPTPKLINYLLDKETIPNSLQLIFDKMLLCTPQSTSNHDIKTVYLALKNDPEMYFNFIFCLMYSRGYILLVPSGEILVELSSFIEPNLECWDANSLFSTQMVLEEHTNELPPTVREVLKKLCFYRNIPMGCGKVPCLLKDMEEMMELSSTNDAVGRSVQLYDHYCDLLFTKKEYRKAQEFLELLAYEPIKESPRNKINCIDPTLQFMTNANSSLEELSEHCRKEKCNRETKHCLSKRLLNASIEEIAKKKDEILQQLPDEQVNVIMSYLQNKEHNDASASSGDVMSKIIKRLLKENIPIPELQSIIHKLFTEVLHRPSPPIPSAQEISTYQHQM